VSASAPRWRAPPHHRDDDLELLAGGHRPDRQRRREDALHVGWPVQDPHRLPRTGGAAHQLAAQHSQSLEPGTASVPGLKVVAPSTPYDAKGLLKSAIRDDDPVIFMEGETLYGSKGEVPDEEYTVPIGVTDVKRQGTDVTVVAWSKMVTVALKAAETLAADGISCEVIDPRTLRPLDEGPILESCGGRTAASSSRRGGRMPAWVRRSRTWCSRPLSATSTPPSRASRASTSRCRTPRTSSTW